MQLSAEYQEIAKVFQGLGATPDIQRGQFNLGAQGSSQPQEPLTPIVCTHKQMMYEAFPDSAARSRVSKMIKAELQSRKVDVQDIDSFLQSTLAPNAREVLVMNTDTPVSNLIAAYTQLELYATDWLYIMRTRKFSGLATRVNPEDRTTTSNAVKQAVYGKEVQVISFAGDPVEVSFMASSQASQQQSVNLMQQQVTPVLNSLALRWEYDVINSMIQPNPVPPNITAMQGILAHIETNVDDSGNAAILEAQLEAIVKAIFDVVGYGKQLIFITSYLTTGTIRDIMIERYNGNNPRSFQEANAVLAGKFSDVRVRADQVYEPIAGNPIPVIQSGNLTNTLVCLVLEPELMPNWVRFRFRGNAGPQMFMNYDKATQMVDGQFIMEGRTVDLGPEQTMYKQTRVL